ncbi:MAG: EscU/YscU/HrcU family type III secretion system export apparatus switch protein [Methylococcaceae bacterium]
MLPPNFVVALKYDYEKDNAPTVTAKGAHLAAEQILKIADEHDIPLYKDPELVTILSKIPLGDEIPQDLYLAVAEVIAFAYGLSNKTILEKL